MTWQFPLKSAPQITKQTGWRPRSSSRVVRHGARATFNESYRQFPGNFRMNRAAARNLSEIFHVLSTATAFP
ncbi:MAG TPA: hypothetical protein DCQ92_15620 [Verrucomicrobia subdivision 3 bacterium]|nr:hypothetical protein [Limisphaerales bacterium]